MWLPNVQRKRLWSDSLNRMGCINVTTAALRWIDKAVGLDNYLLHTPPHKLASVVGMEYREILQELRSASSPDTTPASAQ